MKFGAYFGYDLLNCRKENLCASANYSIYLSIFFFSAIKISVKDFSASIEAWFKLCKHLENNHRYCGQENHAAEKEDSA